MLPDVDVAAGESEADKIEAWRAHVLIRAGCPGDLALELAERTEIDLHRAEELFRAGCPAGTARRILS